VNRAGFSLAELIVAMTILSLGVLVLAAAATHAQRSFTDAEALDRAARVAATVLDSLVRVPDPQPGSLELDRVAIHWTMSPGSGVTTIRADVEVAGAGRSHRIVFHARRADAAAPE
jgi:prepilin-type N-terminal cleavage/methylation domain-containing protein